MIVPADYYYKPTQFDVDEDPGWVTGYLMGAQIGIGGHIPDPVLTDTYSGYRSKIYNLFGKSPFNMAVVNFNVGWDDSVADGAECNWDKSPTSPHNVATS